MKRTLLALFVFLTLTASAQIDTTKYYRSFDYGWRHNRAKFINALTVPSDTVTNKLTGSVVMLNDTFYVRTEKAWEKVSGDVFQKSIFKNGSAVELVNDQANPGPLKVYGTDSNGVKKWDIPRANPSNIAEVVRQAHFNTVFELMASDYNGKGFKRVTTAGYYASGDGGGATYRWVDTSTKTADTAFVIKPTGVSGAGRWELVIPDGRLNIMTVGGRPDQRKDYAPSPGYYTDHNKIMDKVFAYAKANPDKYKTVYFPHGEGVYAYFFPRKLQVRLGLTLEGDPVGSLDPPTCLAFYGTAGIEHLGGNAPGGGSDDFTVKNFTIVNIVSDIYQADGKQYGIFSNGRIMAENVTVKYFKGDGWRIEACGAGQVDPNGDAYNSNSDAFTLTNCGAWYNAGNGLTIKGCDANGGMVRRFVATANKYWGLLDSSTYATTIEGAMFHNNSVYGSVAAYSFPKCYVRIPKGDGTYYTYMARKDNINVAPTPGVSSSTWTYFGINASGTALGYSETIYPLWDAATQYRGGGAYRLDQAPTVMTGTYTEASQGHAVIEGRGLSLGGQQDTPVFGSYAYGGVDGAGLQVQGTIGASNISLNNGQLRIVENDGFNSTVMDVSRPMYLRSTSNINLGRDAANPTLTLQSDGGTIAKGYLQTAAATLTDTTGLKPAALDANGVVRRLSYWPSGGAGSYTLPIASASTLGGVKIGAGLSIDGTGVLSASGGSATPGGASGAIQYNSGGTLGGFGAWDGSGVTITNAFPYLKLKNNTATTGREWGVISRDNGEFGVYDYTTGAYRWRMDGTGKSIFNLANIEPDDAYMQAGNGVLVKGDYPAYYLKENSGQAWRILSVSGEYRIYDEDAGAYRFTIDGTGKVIVTNDIEITDSTKGIILKSPNGHRWRVTVSDTGVLTTTDIGL